MALLVALPFGSATAENVRIATFAAPLSRDGPGLLLKDIRSAQDPQILAILGVIDRLAPDILVLTEIDYDAGGQAVLALSQAMADPLLHHYSAAPNAGLATGLDMDGNGRLGEARDAMGYGRFFGDGGVAILSRWPIDSAAVTDFTELRWADLPGATLPQMDDQPFPSAEVQDVWRLSSSVHWMVPITAGDTTVTLLVHAATPPVFDGPEDANGLRNRDELRLWAAVLDGDMGPVPQHPILVGKTNLDPFDGDGLGDAMSAMLARADLQNPAPVSAGARAAADADHSGPPDQDTALWPDGPGALRVSYILPFAAATVTGAGVFWPAPETADAALLGGDGQAAGPHRLVWVDLNLEGAP